MSPSLVDNLETASAASPTGSRDFLYRIVRILVSPRHLLPVSIFDQLSPVRIHLTRLCRQVRLGYMVSILTVAIKSWQLLESSPSTFRAVFPHGCACCL